MGRRKKSAKKPKASRKRETLATVFDCLFCNNKSSVTVKLDQKAAVGNLSCSSCGESFQSPIHHLSEAVDVYSDWVDACHAVAERDAKAMGPLQPIPPKRGGRGVPVAPQQDAETGLFDEDDDDEEDEDPIRIFERFDRLKSARSAARKARADKPPVAKSTDEVAAGSSSS
jgi:transcription elongation factor Elf1